MRRLRRLFNRAGPDRTEIGILRGILTAAMRHRAVGGARQAFRNSRGPGPDGDGNHGAPG